MVIAVARGIVVAPYSSAHSKKQVEKYHGEADICPT
jgi:hypothetical protein